MSSAREIEGRIAPAEIILPGSRAEGVHCTDSNVDLTAVCPNVPSGVQADKVLREMLAGKCDDPVVNVNTITQAEFLRLAPLAQSFAGQSARHGVTPDGESLGYRPDREPAPERIRDGTRLWVYLAREEQEFFLMLSGNDQPGGRRLLPFHAQQALQWAVKGLLYGRNDPGDFDVTRRSCGGTCRASGP